MSGTLNVSLLFLNDCIKSTISPRVSYMLQERYRRPLLWFHSCLMRLSAPQPNHQYIPESSLYFLIHGNGKVMRNIMAEGCNSAVIVGFAPFAEYIWETVNKNFAPVLLPYSKSRSSPAFLLFPYGLSRAA